MKSTTKLILMVTVLLSLNGVYAQNGARAQQFKQKMNSIKANNSQLTPEQRATKSADSLKAKLNLTSDQYAKILAINKNYFAQIDPLKTKAKADTVRENKKQYKDQIQGLFKARKKEIVAILTPEQQAAWKQFHQDNRNENNNRNNPSTKPKKEDDTETEGGL